MGRPKLPRDEDGNIIREQSTRPVVASPLVEVLESFEKENPEMVHNVLHNDVEKNGLVYIERELPYAVSFLAGSLFLRGEGASVREAVDELVEANPLPRRRYAMMSVSFKGKKGRPIVIKPFQLRFLWSKPETRAFFAKRLSTTL